MRCYRFVCDHSSFHNLFFCHSGVARDFPVWLDDSADQIEAGVNIDYDVKTFVEEEVEEPEVIEEVVNVTVTTDNSTLFDVVENSTFIGATNLTDSELEL